MAKASAGAPLTDLLHPEILSKDEIISILRQRNVPLSSAELLNKQALLESFYKNVIPRPQRIYRGNRRGQEMTEKQIIMSKRKRTYDEMDNAKTKTSYLSKLQESKPTSKFPCSYNLPQSSSSDRLKPPPVLFTGERKIIKLNSCKSSVTSSTETGQPTQTGVIKLTGNVSSANVRLTNNAKSSSNGIAGSMDKKVHKMENDASCSKLLNKAAKVDNVDQDTVIKKISSVTITKIMPEKTKGDKATKAIKLKRRSFTSGSASMALSSPEVKVGEGIDIKFGDSTSKSQHNHHETMDNEETNAGKKYKDSN